MISVRGREVFTFFIKVLFLLCLDFCDPMACSLCCILLGPVNFLLQEEYWECWLLLAQGIFQPRIEPGAAVIGR